MIKLKFKNIWKFYSNLKYSNELLLSLSLSYNFFHVKWHKDLSAKYYQDNKERLQKLVKDVKVLLKKIKKKKIETIWTWVIQKSLRRWKAKTG